MPSVSKAPPDVLLMIEEMVDARYPLLATARIGCLFADDVKESGQFVAAKVKVNNEADRLDGKPDATITVDRPGWNLLGMLPWEKQQRRKRAILEGALYSLEVEVDNGEVQTDDEGRPLMTKRPADWFLCGFRAMAGRYGEDSLEVIEAARLKELHGELLFGFMEKTEPANLKIRATEIFEEVARQVNAGAMGRDVTATVNGRARPEPEAEGDEPLLPKFTPGLKLFGCNRCLANRARDVPVCPVCHSPEFSLLVVDADLKAVKDEEALAALVAPPKRRRKAEPEAAEARSS